MAKQAKPPAKDKAAKPPKPPKQPMSAKTKKKLYWGGGLAFFGLVVVMFMAPVQGSMRYGICKTYVELNELYPKEINYLSVEDGDPVKIYYKKVDPFGVSSVNSIECYFKRDPRGAFSDELSKVDINGKSRTYEAEKPENIKKFNVGIPAILAYPPDLTLPFFQLDNISQYKDIQ